MFDAILFRSAYIDVFYKVLKSDVYIYLDADKELQEADQKKEYLKQVVNYLERVLREINNRNWNIRNTIEWKKFIHGE